MKPRRRRARRARSLLPVLLCLAAGVLAPPCAVAGEFELASENSLWDPFKLSFVAKWDVNLGPYTRTVPGEGRTELANVRAVFETKRDFEAYRVECDAGARRKVVERIATAARRDEILKVVDADDREQEVGFLTADALSLIPEVGQAVWPVAVVSVLKDLLEETDYSKHIQRTRSDLQALLAVGGELEMEERLYRATDAQQQWMIYRSLVYRVAVGDEKRMIPLVVQTLRVQVKS